MELRCLDLDAAHEAAAAEALAAWLPRLAETKVEETEVAVRRDAADGEAAFVPRLQRSKTQVNTPTVLQMSARGSLANLRPVPQEERLPPPAGWVELRIRAIGLNFRDVLNVMGLYPGDPGNPGGDCSGTVVSVSDGVSAFKPGDDVFGITEGCIRTYRNTDALLLDRKPASWSFEQAAAWPVTFTTTEEAFTDMAKLKKGERVLIHAATGGVGVVAVQYAQRVGAVVYATAGKEEKQQWLSDMGVKYMKKGGRFMEIGKRNVYTKEQMTAERPDVYYELLALDYYMAYDRPKFNELLTRFLPQAEKGWWKPVPVTTFEGLEKGPDAF